MKTYRSHGVPILAVLLGSLLGSSGVAGGQETQVPATEHQAVGVPLGSSFLYTGRLVRAGAPLTGLADFKFALFDAAEGGVQVGPTRTLTRINVVSGWYQTLLDFGTVTFDGSARWLSVGYRSPPGSGRYVAFPKRQAVGSAPYALYAGGAPWSGLTGMPDGFADASDNDTLASLPCKLGQVAKLVGESWVCEKDNDTLASLPCKKGQVAKWTGESWICEDDNFNVGDITSVYPALSSGLTGGGASGDVNLGVDFGTGFAQAARGNHNHDAAYASINHNHNSAYLGKAEKAADSNLLNGMSSSQFMQGGGEVVRGSLTISPSSGDVPVLATASWDLYIAYHCQANVNWDGMINFHNNTPTTLNMFFDNGGLDPEYTTLQGGGWHNYRMARAAGDHYTIQVQGGQMVATFEVFSVHRPSSNDCYVQMQGVVSR